MTDVSYIQTPDGTTLTIKDAEARANSAIYKGTIGDGGTISTLPATHKVGWLYKVITAGTYAGVQCNVNDMIICIVEGTTANNSHWNIIHSSNIVVSMSGTNCNISIL